jgi:hypothetical protein
MVLDIRKQFPNAELGEFGGAPDNLTLKLRSHYGDSAAGLRSFIISGNLFETFFNILISQMTNPNINHVRKPHPEQDKTVLVFNGAYFPRFI